MIGAADLASGESAAPPTSRSASPTWSSFTKLGEEIATEELGLVAGRLEEMATAVAEPPVRLVKLIGDAAMLVSTEAEPMLRGGAARWSRPPTRKARSSRCLRAGVAYGPALAQAGDYYGRPVNLASRITGVARPGSVLARRRGQGGGRRGFDYSFAGEKRLKGFDSRFKLFRARRPEPK